MAETKKRFCLSIYTEEILTVDQIWPDGDAPENPTAEDVKKLIKQTCGWEHVVSDWNLSQDRDVREVK